MKEELWNILEYTFGTDVKKPFVVSTASLKKVSEFGSADVAIIRSQLHRNNTNQRSSPSPLVKN